MRSVDDIVKDLREFLEVEGEDNRSIAEILGDNPIGQGAALDLMYHVSYNYHIPESDLISTDLRKINIPEAGARIHDYLAANKLHGVAA